MERTSICEEIHEFCGNCRVGDTERITPVGNSAVPASRYLSFDRLVVNLEIPNDGCTVLTVGK